MTRAESIARVLLRLYPHSWRERYGEELVALIDTSGLNVSGAADLILGAAREQGRAFVRGEKRGFFEHAVAVLVVTAVSTLLSRAIFGAGDVAMNGPVVVAPQYISLMAIVRGGFATPGRLGKGARIGPAELMVWLVAALLCGAILQAHWHGPIGFWVMGNVHLGFGAAGITVLTIYFAVVTEPGRRARKLARLGRVA